MPVTARIACGDRLAVGRVLGLALGAAPADSGQASVSVAAVEPRRAAPRQQRARASADVLAELLEHRRPQLGEGQRARRRASPSARATATATAAAAAGSRRADGRSTAATAAGAPSSVTAVGAWRRTGAGAARPGRRRRGRRPRRRGPRPRGGWPGASGARAAPGGGGAGRRRAPRGARAGPAAPSRTGRAPASAALTSASSSWVRASAPSFIARRPAAMQVEQPHDVGRRRRGAACSAQALVLLGA